VRELRDRSPIEVLRDRNPIEFVKKRADLLAQRSADLKRLADAWEPLYQNLDPDLEAADGLSFALCITAFRPRSPEREARAEEEDWRAQRPELSR
jgi:hypothetical protein